MGVGRPIARTNFYEIEMKRLEVKWGGGKRPNARTGSEKISPCLSKEDRARSTQSLS